MDSFTDTSFVINEDKFEDVEINSVSERDLWWFKNNKKGLIKQFILCRTQQVEYRCVVTLVKNPDFSFSPRFNFEVWNITKKAQANYQRGKFDDELIKAKVSLDICHENFLKLLQFIFSLSEINTEDREQYAIVRKSEKDIFDHIDKATAVVKLHEKYGTEITEQDVNLLLNRKSRLEHFKKLLTDSYFFASERFRLGKEGKQAKSEFVWQSFFEENQWIFGYGLQLVACEGLDDKKLEVMVVGNDVFEGGGKRIDALLKTKGNISKLLFCEIKLHLPDLLIEPYDRPNVFVPKKELRGAVAQIQKTIHKATLKARQKFEPVQEDGSPTGEEILFVKPRGIVVIGTLDDFKTPEGINYEKLSSFELYRQQVNGIDIITYDELYERARFIVEDL